MSSRKKTVNNNNSWDLDAMLAQEIQDLNKDSAEDRRVKEAVIVSKPDPNRINNAEDSSSSDSDEYEDDLSIRDPELFKITESNRQINVDIDTTTKNKLVRRPPELVFSDPPLLVSRDDYIQVTFAYGVSEKKNKKSKKYMLMCDFGEESMYALKWAIGTLLRDGDEVHVASVVSMDEEVEDMDDSEKYTLWSELDRNSKTVISRVKTTLIEMMLFDIKIVIHSLAGKTRESLLNLIYETPGLTMIVCGSREKSALKGMIMGSVSTFLVHNSPVPVSVVRPQKKEKTKRHKKTAAQKLSQSVMNGHLKVDEAEGAPLSLNSYDGTT
ncbi:uncharacterized protein B0P05DRAFT_520422 [Gilbertella persicaria]|uniref:uncharacterized protein n=1 Tax=Gilbertella persicaria TaxID=101096 RepID=UPI002220891A|nr:uncharacterized protein B0P05DRAFT_520422 [Gilbertella persicaria]KAI8098106.1 hypothetical protein B0P05DRAFT_520422 [Gilbertella persicaria]